jgi:2-keto-4-pentenoate hydratase
MNHAADLSEADLQRLALELREAHHHCREAPLVTERFPGFDTESAYDVASRVLRLRLAEGAVSVGRKIGFTNPDMWARYGVSEPVWGHMYNETVQHLPPAGGLCSISRFASPKIEPEIALHFRSSPPAGAAPAAILACVDWVAHAFEIVQCHFPGWRFKAADTIADGGLHGALFLGEPAPVAVLGSDPVATLERFSVTLFCNGSARETARGTNVLGSPLLATAHLLSVLARQGQRLHAGEIVTTGTLTSAYAVQAGESWHTELQDIALPGIALKFVA